MSSERDLPPPDLAGDFALVRSQIEELKALADEDETLARADAGISGWAVGQHVQHLAITLLSIHLALRSLVRGRGEEGEGPGEMASTILDSGDIPRGEAQAPEGMRPQESPSPDEIRTAVKKASDRWETLAEDRDAVAACPLRVPHPILGPLSAPEWVRFAAVHNAHHLCIVDDLRESPATGGPVTISPTP
jgi:hypothetical protein